MNYFYDKNTEEDFKKACQMSSCEYSHSELMQMLENGDVVQKQIAALSISTITDEKDAETLLNNLTGCDGKIREAVAYKICGILNAEADKSALFIKSNIDRTAQILANATIDINGNICKFVLSIVEVLMKNEKFSKLYTDKIISMIFETFKEIDKFVYKDKKYVINKQLFKLYWCLEAIKTKPDAIEKDVLRKILERAALEQEYTIREKVAQILTKFDEDVFLPLKEKMMTDENYYVRIAMK